MLLAKAFRKKLIKTVRDSPRDPLMIPWGNIMKHHETSWNIMRHHETSWNIMKHHETSWNIMKHHETSWNIMKHHEKSWSIMKHHETSWNIMKHHETSWNIMKHHETSWSIMKHHEASQSPPGPCWAPGHPGPPRFVSQALAASVVPCYWAVLWRRPWHPLKHRWDVPLPRLRTWRWKEGGVVSWCLMRSWWFMMYQKDLTFMTIKYH